MLATSMVSARAVTQSMPQMIDDSAPEPCAVEHAYRPQPGAGGDADDAAAVVFGGGDAGDVGAVAVEVGERAAPGDAVDPADDVEVAVFGVDAGVDDGDVHVDVATSVPGRGGALVGADPIDARRQRLGGDRDPTVRHDRGDAGVGSDVGGLRRRHPRRVATQGPRVDELHLGAVAAAVGEGHGAGVAVSQCDDVRVGDHVGIPRSPPRMHGGGSGAGGGKRHRRRHQAGEDSMRHGDIPRHDLRRER